MSKASCESFEKSSPSQRCLWTVHITSKTEEIYEQQGWLSPRRPPSQPESSFSSCLQEALRGNEFSSIPEDQLPVSISEIARQITRKPDDLVLESVAFAIMSCNCELLSQTLDDMSHQETDITSIYPLHMAAACLNGGRACCEIFAVLRKRLPLEAFTKDRFANEYGHTVLDSFLLTILRNHTTVNMKMVDETLGDNAVIPGQEVDICDRWSADSKCFRNLVASGTTTIPASWKHKFCHTSVQAVLHSTRIVLLTFPTMRNLPSGLFKRQCFGCGLRLQLGPLHALVMTAFCLASIGAPKEDLFGVVAYYLALVAEGASVLTQCAVSPSRLLGSGSNVACSHEKMTPYEMAMAIEAEVPEYKYSKEGQIGWNVYTTIMRLAEACIAGKTVGCIEQSEHGTDDGEEEHLQYSKHCPHKGRHRFGNSPILGHIWAAIQAELTSYRRADENDGWLSHSFSMQALLESLVRGDSPDVGYIKDSKLMPYCRCGKFEVICGYRALFLEQMCKEGYRDLVSADTFQRCHFLVHYTRPEQS